MFALALLLPIPEMPIIAASSFPVKQQWNAIEACPVIQTTKGNGSGVVIGKREGFLYVLTAAHVVPFDAAGIEFYTRDSWPKPAWRAEEARVVQKWPNDVDLALVRCQVGSRDPGLLSLAAPRQRPKEFPVTTYTVGAARGIAPTFEIDSVLAKRLVRSKLESPGVTFFWEMERRSRPGRSGGPLLDPQGNVIGICAATQGGRGYYVHLDEIQAALKRGSGEYSWMVPAHRE